MPFSAQHNLVTVFGDGYAGEETWSFGLRFNSDAASTQAEADAALAAVVAWWGDPGVGFTDRVRLLGVKIALIDTDGRYEETIPPIYGLLDVPQTGTSSQGVAPQLSTVVSLETGYTLGRAKRGRIYLPPMAHSLNSTARIPAGDTEAIADAAADLISSLNLAGFGRAVVMSQVGSGVTREITEVRVGNVVDTQRRRRNQLAETYSPPTPIEAA